MAPSSVHDRLIGHFSRLERLGLGRPKLQQAGLSLPQFGLLACLWREPGLHAREVAEKLGVTMPTVSVALRRLEQGGWLHRRPDPEDKRSARLYLSPKASLVAKQVGNRRKRYINEFLEALSTDEQEQLLNLLDKAITHLESKRKPATQKAAQA
jgi:DNA-binding MarR family transcriptional regulator